ncbi:MAG: hypothetical protein J6W79_02775 [Alphaproteobacteria bacterium]|nr:hypothetical protein [Alphaproteobacteria bacterium]
MKPLKDFFVPKDYAAELSQLKEQSFAWKMDFSSKTEIANIGHITHYEIRDAKPYGNLVLVPGLASNTDIEPMMRAITYWSLKHKFNIYAIDSFFGDFTDNIDANAAAKNTVPEFVDLMDAGLDIVAKMSVNQWTCVIGHSLAGGAVLEVFNRRILKKQPIGYSAAVLFAPYVVRGWLDATKDFVKWHQYPDVSYAEFYNSPIGVVSPHDFVEVGYARRISVYPKVYDDDLKPRPDLMAQYKIPITLVAGGKDRKAPVEFIRGICDATLQYSNKTKITFVEFPESKHSFINQHNDWNAVLRLIQSQRVRTARTKVK